jgi:hypothetical protein
MCIRADSATFEGGLSALLRENLWFTCQHDVVAQAGSHPSTNHVQSYVTATIEQRAV